MPKTCYNSIIENTQTQGTKLMTTTTKIRGNRKITITRNAKGQVVKVEIEPWK